MSNSVATRRRLLHAGCSVAILTLGACAASDRAGGVVDLLGFAYASCQQFGQGWFTAHRHIAAENPHLKLADGSVRGYVVMTLGRSTAQGRLRVVETVKQKGAAIRTLATIVVQDGRPGPVVVNAQS